MSLCEFFVCLKSGDLLFSAGKRPMLTGRTEDFVESSCDQGCCEFIIQKMAQSVSAEVMRLRQGLDLLTIQLDFAAQDTVVMIKNNG